MKTAVIPHIKSLQYRQEFFTQPFSKQSFSPKIIESVRQEILDTLAIADGLLSADDATFSRAKSRVLFSYLNLIADPRFRMQSSEKCTRDLILTLLEIKRFQHKRIAIRVQEKKLVPEHHEMNQLEHLLISMIAHKKNLQDQESFIIDKIVEIENKEMLFCQRGEDRYEAELLLNRGKHPLSVAHIPNYLYRDIPFLNKPSFPLFLDENNQPIRGKAITIYSSPLAYRLQLIEAGRFLEAGWSQFLVSYHFNLGNKEQLVTISCAISIDLEGYLISEYISPLPGMLQSSQEHLEILAKESKALIAIFQSQVPEAQAEGQCILLSYPATEKDWNYLNQRFLLTLVHNIESKESSEEEREQSLYLLQHYIDQVELELPAKEGEEGETREMTPKEAYGAILKLLPKEQPVEKLDPRLLEEDKQKAHPFKPKRKKALAAAEGEAKEEPPSAAEPALLLTDRQKEVIDEIYAGKPQKAKAFFEFVRALLGQQEGVWFSQKGSHFTAHRKGKVSVTLVKPHGRDPNARGSLKHQRNVLRQWMGWDAGNHPAALLR